MAEMKSDGEIVRCVDCKRQTSRTEALARIFRRGACGHCGGSLIEAQLCGAVSPSWTICFAEAGHPGPHRGTVEWN